MDAATAALIEVRASWANRHCWSRGTRLHQPAPGSALWLMLEGEALVRGPAAFKPEEWRVKAGDAFIWPAERAREISTPEGATWITIGLQAVAFGRLDLITLLEPPVLWRPDAERQRLLEVLLSQLVLAHEASAGRASGASSLVRAGLERALFGLCWQMLRGEDVDEAINAVAPAWLARALKRCAQEPPPGVADLAREAGLSPAQFRRAFRHWMGLAPREHLQSYRLETARRLLVSTSQPVGAVAVQAGFYNASHFTRAFKRAYGATPAAYRRGAREGV